MRRSASAGKGAGQDDFCRLVRADGSAWWLPCLRSTAGPTGWWPTLSPGCCAERLLTHQQLSGLFLGKRLVLRECRPSQLPLLEFHRITE